MFTAETPRVQGDVMSPTLSAVYSGEHLLIPKSKGGTTFGVTVLKKPDRAERYAIEAPQ